MQLDFDNPKHEALVNNFEDLSRKYDKPDKEVAEDILATINALHAADCLSDVPRSFRPHPLRGEYKGCFAVNVTKKERVIFRPDHAGDSNFRIDNYKTITAIVIIEIFKDYH